MRVQNRRCDSRPSKKAGQTAKSLIIHDRSDPHRGSDLECSPFRLHTVGTLDAGEGPRTTFWVASTMNPGLLPETESNFFLTWLNALGLD